MRVTLTAYGKRHGFSQQHASKLAQRGVIVRREDGSVDVEASDAALAARAKSRAGGKRARASATDDLASVAKQQLDAAGGAMLSHAQAVQKKENYLALLRELEYDREVGKVVEIDAVVSLVAAQFATVRTRLLAIPSKVASRIALIQTPEEARALVEAEITEALKELADDGRHVADAISAGQATSR